MGSTYASHGLLQQRSISTIAGGLVFDVLFNGIFFLLSANSVLYASLSAISNLAFNNSGHASGFTNGF